MSETIGVHCGMCGKDLGDSEHVGDYAGLALFQAHLPECPVALAQQTGGSAQ